MCKRIAFVAVLFAVFTCLGLVLPVSEAEYIPLQPVSYITVASGAVEPYVAVACEPLPAALFYTQQDVEALARTVYGEARGCSPMEQRLVVWTVLQRLDDTRWPDTISEVVRQPNQFKGYSELHPLDNAILTLCEEEAAAWAGGASPPVAEPWAPEIPYFFFDSRGGRNYFRETW